MKAQSAYRLSAVAVVVLALSACSASGGSTSTPSGPVALQVDTWASPTQLPQLQAIANQYVKLHPAEVKSIKIDAIALDAYPQTLATQVAANHAPDVAWILESESPTYIPSGALYNLKPTFQNTSGYNLSDVVSGSLASWSQGGGIYAYPFSSSPLVIYANTDLIAKAGMPDPSTLLSEGKWTWDEVEKIGAAVSKTTGGSATGWPPIADGLGPDVSQSFTPFWRAWGVAPYSGKNCTMTSPASTDLYTFLNNAMNKDHSFAKPGDQFDFLGGSLAFSGAQKVSYTASLKGVGFKWEILPLPSGPAGDPQVVGTAGIGVFKSSQAPKAAADFVAYMTNPANSMQMLSTFLSPRKSLQTPDVMTKAFTALTASEINTVVTPAFTSGVGSILPNANVSQVFASQIESILAANADVPAALKQACAEITPILAG